MKINGMVIVMVILAVVVGAGAGFFGGIKYQQSKQPVFGAGRQLGTRTGTNSGMMGLLRPLTGQIIASDVGSVIVKMQDSSSRIVLVSDKTTINKTAATTKDDLKIGDTVAVIGQTNSDGSVTAREVTKQ
jgi:Domain of unknown function (DUF5666)